MNVTLNIPDKDWYMLAGEAEKAGVRVADILKERIFGGARSVPRRPVVVRDRVLAEWERGTPDPVIAHRLGESLESVRAARRRLGLQAHKFRRELWVQELKGPEVPDPSSLNEKESK